MTLIINLPDTLAFNFHNITSAISALFIIIGAIGIIKLSRWGIYFLALSIVFPIILFFFQAATELIVLVSIIDLIIFVDILLVYKACSCKDVELQKKFITISKKYILSVSIIILAVLLAMAVSIISCTLGYSRASGVTKALGLGGIVNEVQEIGGGNNIK